MEAAAGATLRRGVDAALAVASAVVIAYGVIALGWSVFFVMALFWFENVVIGGFNVLRMLVSGVRLGTAGLIGALFTAAFFTVHYGLFTLVHGVFVVMLFGMPDMGREAMNGGPAGPVAAMLQRLVADRDAWIAIGAILGVHAVSFLQWARDSRELPTPLSQLMSAPYGRIVVLHITLIAGGFLVMSLHAPVLGVLLLLTLKLAYDLHALRRAPQADEERQAQVRARRLLLVGRRNLP